LQPVDLRQDEDALDTWFSSWLWPMSVFNGLQDENNPEIDYYYPTSDLVTGPDIIFFWVARMIMAGLEYRQEVPFKNVYFTGIVRDKQRRKMSKSLGNSPDPIELIEKYTGLKGEEALVFQNTYRPSIMEYRNMTDVDIINHIKKSFVEYRSYEHDLVK